MSNKGGKMKVITINNANFKKEVLENQKVLVDFNATWCGPCRMLKPILEEFSGISTVKVCACDVDQNEELALEYQVSSIPCLILFENGKEAKRSVGLISMNELKDFVGE